MEPSIEFVKLQDPELGELEVTKDPYGKSCTAVHRMIDILSNLEDFEVTFDGKLKRVDRYVPGEFKSTGRKLVSTDIWGRKTRDFKASFENWKVSGSIDQAFDKRVKEGLAYTLVYNEPDDPDVPSEEIYHKDDKPKYYPYLDINLESENYSVQTIKIRPDKRGLGIYSPDTKGDRFIGYLVINAVGNIHISLPELLDVGMPILEIPEPVSIHNL